MGCFGPRTDARAASKILLRRARKHKDHYCEDGVLSVRRRDPRQRIPSAVEFRSPPAVIVATDADCPPGKPPR